MALTAKQALFVKHYLVSLNATQSAIEAGYSEKTAKEMGHENLTKPHISEAISKALAERSQRVEWTAEDILRDIKTIAKNGENESVKLKALELGGKHLGMFKDKVELTGDEGGPLKVMFNIPRPQR